jgi:hypothetical protein
MKNSCNKKKHIYKKNVYLCLYAHHEFILNLLHIFWNLQVLKLRRFVLKPRRLISLQKNRFVCHNGNLYDCYNGCTILSNEWCIEGICAFYLFSVPPQCEGEPPQFEEEPPRFEDESPQFEEEPLHSLWWTPHIICYVKWYVINLDLRSFIYFLSSYEK